MEHERKRILRMLTEGRITVEECEELLRALNVRDAERVEKEKKRAREGKRPTWPYVLVAVLVGWVLISRVMVPWVVGVGQSGISLFPTPPFMIDFGGIIGLALFVFWLAMLINCLTRKHTEFRLLFTQKFSYEKWIWLAIIVLGQVLAAFVYYIVIVHRAGEPEAPAEPTEAAEEEPEREPSFTPRRRAGALWPWVTLLVVLTVAGLVAVGLIRTGFGHAFGYYGPEEAEAAWVLLAPAGLFVLFLGVFWGWMLVDCLTRDYREFGTLLCADRSADKLFWLILILFLPLVGAIAYHIGMRRLPRRERGLRPTAEPSEA